MAPPPPSLPPPPPFSFPQQGYNKRPKLETRSSWEAAQERIRRAAPPPPLRSAWNLLQQQRQSACSGIPLLQNSIFPWCNLTHKGTLYELAGAAGTGKTQIALQACWHAIFGGHRPHPSLGHALYLSLAPGKVPQLAQRAAQMLTAQDVHHHPDLLARLHFRDVSNQDDLLELLQGPALTQLLQQHTPVRLLIIDNLADLFRTSDDDAHVQNRRYFYIERSARLLTVAALLQTLPVPVLVLNQVTWSDTKPALGLTWAHCVHSSFVVTRAASRLNDENQRPSSAASRSSTGSTSSTVTTTAWSRTLRLVKSPCHATPTSAAFVIRQDGVYYCGK